jgi:adenine-specific DNA-methyltransferase
MDFGIYRILNYKRKQIEKFIDDDLKNKVEMAFAKYKDERMIDINQKFEKAKENVIKNIGDHAFNSIGDLKEEFKNTNVGRDYLDALAHKKEAEAIDEIKDSVFNDLYNFFSRYYEEGDFIPQYRYSIKGHKYAIPYNGEEVKLYWANQDQYYIKTGILFRDYTFMAEDFKVIFRTVSAKEELGSNKATKERFFVLDDQAPVNLEDKNLIIRFQYRELTQNEVMSYGVEGGGNNSKQEKINQKSFSDILNKVSDNILKARLEQPKNEKPILLYHINRFTAKNTKDYFIHKNLKKFLSEQLDYFIKAEVLNIETIENERFLDKHITRAKVVREIGEDIIDFLSQIEDFQKRLWEKKKFVLKTEYVITTDRVPEEIYEEIWKNKEQKKEWEELGFEIPRKKEELKTKKLPIDTKYFSQKFKEKLLERLTQNADLDDLLDGLLIKSENYQALNLLLGKYRKAVKCIYLDPPFNSKTTEILYKNFYKHSSWLSLMENRISYARQLLEDKGIFICAIDENEQEKLGLLLDYILPEFSRTCVSIVHNPRGIQGENFSYCHEFAYFLYPGDGAKYIGERHREEPDIRTLRDSGTESLRANAKNCFYPFIVKNGKITEIGEVVKDEKFHPKSSNVPRKDGTIEIWPIDSKGIERKWRYARDSIHKIFDKLEVKSSGDKLDIFYAKETGSYRTVWDEPRYDASEYGTKLLQNMFAKNIVEKVSYPKSLYNVKDCIYASTQKALGCIILDFFAGSGTTAHAVMKLNKEDGGKRKFILVEMADYFDTVVIPRIKKVAYSFNWKDGKPQDKDGIGVFLKYQYLEQYEDSLDNIELRENNQAQLNFGDNYLLKYFLDFETRGSPYLLNIEKLKNPFSYKLKVNLSEVGEPQEVVVDIPETFNYLLGIKLKKIRKRKNNGKDYLFIFGEKEGQTYAIVWRELSLNEEEIKRDKEFIREQLRDLRPQIVYVNCPENTILTPDFGDFRAEIKYIEPEFKKLMEVTGSYDI